MEAGLAAALCWMRTSFNTGSAREQYERNVDAVVARYERCSCSWLLQLLLVRDQADKPAGASSICAETEGEVWLSMHCPCA